MQPYEKDHIKKKILAAAVKRALKLAVLILECGLPKTNTNAFKTDHWAQHFYKNSNPCKRQTQMPDTARSEHQRKKLHTTQISASGDNVLGGH